MEPPETRNRTPKTVTLSAAASTTTPAGGYHAADRSPHRPPSPLL
jgi:hypothetical protein